MVCKPSQVSWVEELLSQEGFEFSALPFCELAYMLRKGPWSLGRSVAARLGFIYIQDKSSMLPPLYLSPCPGELVLDFCASPGSKTGFLAQLMGFSGTVLANEPNKKRLHTLRRNLQLMGLCNVLTSGLRGECFPDQATFDRILLDVPCSGWGTEEKHPRVRKMWSPERLGPLLKLQRQLLARAWQLLKPGGILVYSTCTTNREENQEMIGWFLGCFPAELDSLSPLPGFLVEEQTKVSLSGSVALPGTLQINGPASGGQSFFVARIRKPDLTEAYAKGWSNIQNCFREVEGKGSISGDELAQHGGHLAWSGLPQGRLQACGDVLEFFPAPGAGLRAQGLPTIKGVCLGRLFKDRFQVHGLARCLLPVKPVPGQSLVVEEVGTLQALLSGQSLTWTGQGVPAVGLYFKGLPVGWLKVKGRRLLWSDR